jgi:ABC-type antimicrobial peptide transport system permease subunit
MVLAQVLTLTGVGLAIGFGVSRLTTHFVESFLYGMKPNDPLAIVGAIAILLVSAVLAGYLPAWRASRIDPASALRNE